MENLKQSINKTDTLKNNVKIINNQINKTIVRGGGYTSNSLAEKPKRIESLLKEYSKIAIGKTNGIYRDFPRDEIGNLLDNVEATIKYNLSFKPQKLILLGCNVNCIYDNGSGEFIPNAQFGYDKDGLNLSYILGMIYLDSFEFKKLHFSEPGFSFEIYIEIKKFDDKEIVLGLSHNGINGTHINNISIDTFKFVAIG